MLRQTTIQGLAAHGTSRLRRSRRVRLAMRWALSTVAPWALSTGLLVSFTATAGQPRDNAETLVLRLAPHAQSELAMGPSLLSAASAFNLPALSLHDALIPGSHLQGGQAGGQAGGHETARFSYEEPQRLVPMNEYRPRDTLKSAVNGYPELDRSRKTDPLVGLRPSMTRAAPQMSGDELDRLLFKVGPSDLGAQFAPDDGDVQSEPMAFFPFSYSATPQDGTQIALASPVTQGAATPQDVPQDARQDRQQAMLREMPRDMPFSHRSAERQLESIDGSTPSTPRAVALSSATPVPRDLIPVEIAAAPVSRPAAALDMARVTIVPAARALQRAPVPAPGNPFETALATASARLQGRDAPGITIARKSETATPSAASSGTPSGERPDYVAMIGTERMEREQKCLAEAVYYEARSEPEQGQAAVAQVVLNRVRSGLYPDNVCGVVYQNRHRHLACQFTFACEGRALRINEPVSWATAVRVAHEVTTGHTYLADVGGSTHYHATYVRPWWARKLTKMDSIGRHVFYKLKPGQT